MIVIGQAQDLMDRVLIGDHHTQVYFDRKFLRNVLLCACARYESFSLLPLQKTTTKAKHCV